MNCYCKKCGKLANVDDTVVLTSYPPQFNYSCPHCGAPKQHKVICEYCSSRNDIFILNA